MQIKQMFPKISFILPIYNVQSYLSDAIESILRQTISKEIILVDDGSTDGCLDISLHYAKQYPFIYVVHSQNKGVGAVRNAGLRMAQGEYVYFLDPDDTLDKNLDMDQVFNLAKQYDVVAVKGQFTNYNEETPHIVYYNLPANEQVNENTFTLQPLHTFWAKSLNNSWFTPNACFLFLREFLVFNKIFFPEDIAVGEDGIFNINAFLCAGKVLEIPHIFFNYRINANSVMSQSISSKRLNSLLRCIELIELKKQQTEDNVLKHLLDATAALHRFHFHRDVKAASEIIAREFKHWLTPSFIESYERFNIIESTKKPTINDVA